MPPTSTDDDTYSILIDTKPTDQLEISSDEGNYDIKIDGAEHYSGEPLENGETWIRHATPQSDESQIKGANIKGFTFYLSEDNGSRSITAEAEIEDEEGYVGKQIELHRASTKSR